jgi:DNA-binding response OmpR family regulator
MSNEREQNSESTDLIFAGVSEFIAEAGRRTFQLAEATQELPINYRIAFGLEIIQLTSVEFRILLLLAGRPYHPFTRRQIAEGVNTAPLPVTEDDIDQYVQSLRQKLHGFRDYIQAVPYSGYRFKA